MSKKRAGKKAPHSPEDLRLDPEKRLAAKFDSSSVAKFRVADPKYMGMRVVDNCAEEHIM